MKSNFSRFLHITSSYSGLNRISRSNKFANCLDLDTPIKSECDTVGTNAATCHGRSMVEMLGVLAIIGVLSVGAIAGYSKAMMKYKLNKQAEQLNFIFSGLYQFWDGIDDLSEAQTQNMLTKLNIIPNDLINGSEIIDAMKNKWRIYDSKCDNCGNYSTFLAIEIDIGNDKRESCVNILNFSKEIKTSLWQTHFMTSVGNINNYEPRIYGDIYCTSDVNCLNDLTIEKIDKFCDTCKDTDSCAVRLLWLK